MISSAQAGLVISNDNLSINLVGCTDSSVNTILSNGLLISGYVSVEETTENTALFKFHYPKNSDHGTLQGQSYIYDSSGSIVAQSNSRDLYGTSSGFISKSILNISDDSYYTKVAISKRTDTSKGCVIKSEIASIITNNKPTLSVISAPANEYAVGSTVTLTLSAYDTDGNLKQIDVDWNDGSNNEVVGKLTSNNSQVSFNRKFDTKGSYTISATAYDDKGETSSQVTFSFVIKDAANNKPTLSVISAPANEYAVGSTVTLTLSAYDTDGNLKQIDVDWNDGSNNEVVGKLTSNNSQVSFNRKFDTKGSYTISATAYDDKGETSSQVTFSFVIKDAANNKPTLSVISAPANEYAVGSTVTLILSAYDTDGNLKQIDVDWNDGSDSEVEGRATINNKLETFSRVFNSIGEYTVSTTAYDTDNGVSSIQRFVFNVEETSDASLPTPELNFEGQDQPSSIQVGEYYTFSIKFNPSLADGGQCVRTINGIDTWDSLMSDGARHSVVHDENDIGNAIVTCHTFTGNIYNPDHVSSKAIWTYKIISAEQPKTFDLIVRKQGEGIILSSPVGLIDCGKSCDYSFSQNDKVMIHANAASGWQFSHWNGVDSCPTETCDLVITNDVSITAVFREQEVPNTETRLIDYNPKRFPQGLDTEVTLIGDNLPLTLTANIEGTDGHCQQLTHSANEITLSCTADAQGQKRFYIKDATSEEKHQLIQGTENWHVEITPPLNNNYPSIWMDNFPSQVTLDKQFTVTVKTEDLDGDLATVQADWEGDGDLNRIVSVSNKAGQDILFSYTRTTLYNDYRDTLPLKIRFIATDDAGNQSYFEKTAFVVKPTEISNPVSGVEGVKQIQSSDTNDCEGNPIVPSSGAKIEQKQLLKVFGVVPITFDIGYNSLIRGQSGIGVGWDFANAQAAQIAEKPNGDVIILWSDNQQHKFSPNDDGTYSTESFGCRLDHLTKINSGGFKVERRDRLTYIFNEFNFLTRVENIKGQGVNFEFDTQSRLIRAFEPVSNSAINYFYNDDGFLNQATTSSGRSVLLEYQNEQLTKITHADGKTEEFTYNALDQLINHYIDSLLVSTTTYDSKGRAVEQEDSRDDNLTLKLEYQENDTEIITTITDRTGAQKVKTFNKNYQLIKEINALGEQQSFVYNDDGKPTKITNPRGYATNMAYNLYGDITQLTSPDGAIEKKEYDANRNLTKHTNALNKTTTYSYFDNTNNVEAVTNALGLETSFSYNEQNQQASVTTPEGRTTHYGYGNGLLNSVTSPEGHTRHSYHDADGYKTSETDFQGNLTTYELDGLGRVIKKTDPLGYFETWSYSARGNILTFRDTRYNNDGESNADELRNKYNGQGDLLEKRRVNKTGTIPDILWQYKYDGESRLIESIDPNNNTVKFKRDALGRAIETTDALGNVVKNKFDQNGNVIEAADANGNLAKAIFDNMDRVTTTTDAKGNQQSFVYNLLGQIKSTTNALAQVWNNTYDELSRLVSITHPSSEDTPLVTKQAFDKDNNVTSVVAPSNDARTLVLNDNALLTTEITADSVTQNYSYNENNLISSFTNGRSQQTLYGYDEASRVTSVIDPVSTIAYEYDDNHNVAHVSENNLLITRLFDRFNRVAQYKQNDDNYRGINYLFDKAGNLQQLDYINNNGNQNLPIKYTHDQLNRVTSVTGMNSDVLAVQYEYDENSNVTKVIRGNGTVLVNEYNQLNRLVSSTDTAPDGSIILQQSYTYNAIGQITQETITQDSETPSTPPPAELLTEQVMTYSADNRIASKNSETFDFDADGNMLNIGDMELSFNARNQLASAGDHQYIYNAEGMRTAAISDTQDIRYSLLPDYLNLPQIAWESVANNDGKTDYNFFVYSPYGLVSQLTAKANTLATAHYFHFDYRGSVVAITDENGEVVARYGYTPFGKQYPAEGFEETNNAIHTPFGYNGRDGVITDANGLLYMRARYYSPDLRRFISKDPLRGDISDLGALNRYAYVGGDPVNLVDPSGNTPDYLIDPITTSIGISETYRMYEEGSYVWAAIGAVGSTYDILATACPIVPAGAGAIIGGTNRTVTVVLKPMKKWSKQQLDDAAFKVNVLNVKLLSTVKSTIRNTNQRKKYKATHGAGSISHGKDIDHAIDFQLGGADEIYNYMQLDSSVNKSFGPQIYNQVKNLPEGTKIEFKFDY